MNNKINININNRKASITKHGLTEAPAEEEIYIFFYLLEISWIHTYIQEEYMYMYSIIGLDVGIAYFSLFQMVLYRISIVETI